MWRNERNQLSAARLVKRRDLPALRVCVRIEKLSGGGAELTPNKWSEICMNVDLWRKLDIVFNIDYVYSDFVNVLEKLNY
jgi:hypothetical protein